MMTKRLIVKHNILYDKIYDMYVNKGYTIALSCQKAGISMTNYYYICKCLNKPSVATIK